METASPTLLDALFARRDAERQAHGGKRQVIREEDAILEWNRQGHMRWYMHPDQDDNVIKSLIVYRYEIPPHSRTGKQRSQGNIAAYALSGYGRITVNGTTHDWEARDVIGLPALREGVEMQIFNDSDTEARLIVAQPNFVAIYGVDVGAGFEQLDDAPEYTQGNREAADG